MSTILIVEDEGSLRNVLVEVLQDEGYSLMAASHGRAALEQMRKVIPDLVITDYMMPWFSGLELADAMQQHPQLAGIPVILMSSSVSIGTRATVAAFITKPFDIEELLQIISNVLAPR